LNLLRSPMCRTTHPKPHKKALITVRNINECIKNQGSQTKWTTVF